MPNETGLVGAAGAVKNSVSSPDIVQGVNGGVAERLATQADQVTTEAKITDLLTASRAVKVIDIELVTGAWIVQLETEAGGAIVSTTIGAVAVDGAGAVALPLDLVALGGSFATEIRVFGAGELKLTHASPASVSHPVAKMDVEDAEIIAQRVSKIHAIGASITRLSISWGG
jgi:hypothetical protein